MSKLLFVVFALMLSSGCQEKSIKPSETNTLEELTQLKQDAVTAYLNKDYQKALPLYQQLTDNYPDDAASWFRLGNLHAQLNQADMAIRSYRKAVSIEPKFAAAWHNMGVMQLRQAGNTFMHMSLRINTDDPLYPRAKQLSESIVQILGSRSSDTKMREDK